MPRELGSAVGKRYIATYEMLTGLRFEAGSYPVEPRLEQNLRRAGVIS